MIKNIFKPIFGYFKLRLNEIVLGGTYFILFECNGMERNEIRVNNFHFLPFDHIILYFQTIQ